jgi:hypothetical protein
MTCIALAHVTLNEINMFFSTMLIFLSITLILVTYYKHNVMIFLEFYAANLVY